LGCTCYHTAAPAPSAAHLCHAWCLACLPRTTTHAPAHTSSTYRSPHCADSPFPHCRFCLARFVLTFTRRTARAFGFGSHLLHASAHRAPRTRTWFATLLQPLFLTSPLLHVFTSPHHTVPAPHLLRLHARSPAFGLLTHLRHAPFTLLPSALSPVWFLAVRLVHLFSLYLRLHCAPAAPRGYTFTHAFTHTAPHLPHTHAHHYSTRCTLHTLFGSYHTDTCHSPTGLPFYTFAVAAQLLGRAYGPTPHHTHLPTARFAALHLFLRGLLPPFAFAHTSSLASPRASTSPFAADTFRAYRFARSLPPRRFAPVHSPLYHRCAYCLRTLAYHTAPLMVARISATRIAVAARLQRIFQLCLTTPRTSTHAPYIL